LSSTAFKGIQSNKNLRTKIRYSNDVDDMTVLVQEKSGKESKAYDGFWNKDQWIAASGLPTTHTVGRNYGDLPTHFVLKAPQSLTDYSNSEYIQFKVGDLVIKIKHESTTKDVTTGAITYNHYQEIEWNSRTGVVSAKVKPTPDATELKRMPILCTGTTLGTIPPNTTGVTWGIAGSNGGYSTYSNSNLTLDYHYWYY
jgi:hypothetical protein